MDDEISFRFDEMIKAEDEISEKCAVALLMDIVRASSLIITGCQCR